jgi:hypothetical protein
MINKKHILAIDLIVVVGTLLIIAGFVGYARPLVIAPVNEFSTTESKVLFSFVKGNSILIDDNLDFSSPDEIFAEDNLIINFKPGVYYWKIKGILGSEIRTFTIESEIDLKIKEGEENYEIVNSGNEKLNVDIYDFDLKTGTVILEVDETESVSGTKFIGGVENE